ncbi:MAG: hypothetical protein FJZ95_02935 [Chloroflexi bacterium]|nr:hypothetical protein [Chloroflexota bacterium]
MFKIKGCPRCRGDIFVENALEGLCELCLQCGYRHEHSAYRVLAPQEEMPRRRRRRRTAKPKPELILGRK